MAANPTPSSLSGSIASGLSARALATSSGVDGLNSPLLACTLVDISPAAPLSIGSLFSSSSGGFEVVEPKSSTKPFSSGFPQNSSCA